MSVVTASILRVIRQDTEAIAQGLVTGSSAEFVAGRIKFLLDELVKSAERDRQDGGVS